MSIEVPKKIENKEGENRIVERQELRDGQLFSTDSYEYDQQGRLIKETTKYGKEKEPRIIREYSYDQQGRLIKKTSLFETSRDRDGSKITHTGELELEYQGDSKNPSLESYSKDGSVMNMAENEYDDQGKITKKKTTSFYFGEVVESEERYTYDNQGRISETQRKSSDQSENYFYRNVYGKNGKLLREERGFAGSDRPFGVIEYKYENDGKTVTQTNFYGTEEKELVWRSREKFDDRGRAVELMHISFRNGEESRKDKSTYEYKTE